MGDPDEFDNQPTPQRSHPHVVPARAERSSPIVRVLGRDLDQDDYALASQLRGAGGDPHVLAAAALRVLHALKDDSETSGERMEQALGEAIRKQEKDLAGMLVDMRDVKRDVGLAKWIVRGIFAAIGIFGLYTIDRVLTRTERDGEDKIRMQTMERAIDRIEHERHPDWQPSKP